MSYKILPTRQFEKDLRKLNNSMKEKVVNKINEVSIDPKRYKHMRSPMNNYCRIRIEKLRVIFSYDVVKEELYLEKIVFGHKY